MMKFKVLFLIAVVGLLSLSASAQRGVRIGYIDTEYILQNVPEYTSASSQLNKKVLQWKSEVEQKLAAISQKKKALENESVLLTKALYEERLEDISFEEAEVLDYQQKRFGPGGDLIIQKRQLIAPIQDQIFAAVQQIAETQKLDFVFDKSADVVMLYAAERYDISERVLKTITRSSKRSQAKNKKERQALEKEAVVPIVKDNDDKSDRQKALEAKRAAREAELAKVREARLEAMRSKKAVQDSIRAVKKQEAEAKREKASINKQSKEVSENKSVTKDKSEALPDPVNALQNKTVTEAVSKDAIKGKKPLTVAQIKARDRARRQRALEDRKKRDIEQRKKAREEREKQLKRRDSIAKSRKTEKN